MYKRDGTRAADRGALSAGEARRSVPPGRPAATAVGVSGLAQSMHGGKINNRIFDAAKSPPRRSGQLMIPGIMIIGVGVTDLVHGAPPRHRSHGNVALNGGFRRLYAHEPTDAR